MAKSILFSQYTNPAAYPPLIHASAILHRHGFECHFLGINRNPSIKFAAADKWRKIILWKEAVPGGREWLSYARFILATISQGLIGRHDWIYCSDPITAPAALALHFIGKNVLYHEHDAPEGKNESIRSQIIMWCRSQLVKRVHCIAPGEGRASLLRDCGGSRIIVVPNFPSVVEAALVDTCGSVAPTEPEVIRIIYQGNLASDKIPPAVVEGISQLEYADRIRLDLVGYETQSPSNFVKSLEHHARTLGLGNLINYVGALPRTPEMLSFGCGASIGLSLMPTQGGNKCTATMAGASNKTFDYLCQGITPLCTDLPDWRDFFGDLAYYCNPNEPSSIAYSIDKILTDRATIPGLCAAGSKRIRDEWHYERAFAPVLELISKKIP